MYAGDYRCNVNGLYTLLMLMLFDELAPIYILVVHVYPNLHIITPTF